MSTFFLYVLILFTLLTVKVMRRVSSSSTFSTKTSHICQTQNDTFVHGWRVFYALPHTPNAKSHPCWCDFMFGFFSSPYHTHQTRNDTLLGVILCSDPSLPPRMNFKGCLLNIFLYY